MGQQDIGSGPKGPSIPIVKFRTMGQRIVGALVDEEMRQQQKWVNGKAEGLRFKDDGKPAWELVLTLLVMPGSSAVVVDRDSGDDVPVEAGQLVRHIISGYKWNQYITARDLLGKDNKARTGDLFAQTFKTCSIDNGRGGREVLVTQEQVNAAKLADKVVGKDAEILVRRPGPEHTAIVEQCNAKRAELAQQPVGAGAPAGGGYNPHDEDPF